MAQNFIACDREQPFLLPPDVREWLPKDHLAWFVIDAVDVMDTSAFYAGYREDGHGRAAYEPSMMLALLLYCWSRGVRSSRAIERACVEDVACRVIAAHQRSDHATIARFVERHERALSDLFGEVLALCADAGLATVGVIAIDGTKVHANANRDRTIGYEDIARAIVEEAVATDAAETATFGERRGDELPEILTTRQGREGWLRDARQRLDQRRAEHAKPIPRSRPERIGEAKRRLEEELAVERDANAQLESAPNLRPEVDLVAMTPGGVLVVSVAGRRRACWRRRAAASGGCDRHVRGWAARTAPRGSPTSPSASSRRCCRRRGVGASRLRGPVGSESGEGRRRGQRGIRTSIAAGGAWSSNSG